VAVERVETVESSHQPEQASGPRQRLFTVDEYYKMAEVGILRPDERVELIEGKLIEMPAIGPRHAYNVNRLTVLFLSKLAGRAEIRAQSPVRAATGAEPEPDLAAAQLYSDAPKTYESRHPTPKETHFVVEVSDTTLAFDLGEKAQMYARHGIAELWVVDLQGDAVVVHRQPTADGYASIETMHRGQTVAPVAFPDVPFTIDEILG
jgi:Uma2 family endonuclease